MDAAELEKFIGDLEIAVDRLRSLYEQYFMGIEKMEPLVPRKDVDRRVYVLRKEQIRNTAQRFRFQMIQQRYNTYQTHWQRICREIENGTYKRHVIRAQQRFGDGARRASVAPPAPSAPAASAPAPTAQAAPPALARPGAPPPRELADELAELDRDFGVDVDLDGGDLALDEPVSGPPPARKPAPPTWRKAEPAATRGGSVPPPSPLAPPRPPAAPPPSPTRPQAAPPPSAPRQAPPPPPAQRPPAAPPAPTSAPRPAGGPPPRPRPTAGAGSAPAAPAAPAAPRAGEPRPAAPAAAPARPAPAAPPAHPAPAAAPSRPAAAPPARPASPAAAAAAPRAADLPDERVRQLYAQYVETKRQQKESTAAITYDAVAKSLRDSSAKLREKHGRNVDFEVSVKDGKTILKPVIK